MYNKLLDPITDVRVSAEMLLNGSLGPLTGDQREGIKQLYANAGGLYSLIVDVITNIGLENLSQRAYLPERFNTVLQPLVDNSQSLLAEVDGPLLEEQLVSLLFINETGQMLRKFISRVHLYSQLLNQSLVLHTEKIAVVPLLQSILDEQDAMPTVSIVLAAGETFVLGDRHWLSVALREIITNARHFTRSGEIRIRSEQAGDTLKLYVEDSGIGIAPIYHPRVFEPFFQVDDQAESLGLGLYFAQEIFKLHQSRISLESRIHHGTQLMMALSLSQTD